MGNRKGDDRRSILSAGAARRAQHRIALRLSAARRDRGGIEGQAARPAHCRHRPQCSAGARRSGRSRDRDDPRQAPVPQRRQGSARDRVLMARALMLQGTGSDVGKSLLVAGLARAFTRRGLRVRPFKPQNMSNNAAVTADGGEIGRAQALQGRACRVAPVTDMNPVLLKPQSESGAQVVLHGRLWRSAGAAEYRRLAPDLLPAVLASCFRLAGDADLVLIEGAGSPAEVNLRKGDIANMGFAEAAGVPVVLIGDIERGGVIAQLVGTHALLTTAERALLTGYIVNKFRGDIRLFNSGVTAITAR